MSQGFFTAISGIKASQSQIDVISDNIANISTAGFKANNVTFENVFVKTLTAGTAPTSGFGGTNPMQIGLGTTVSQISRSFTSGPVQTTGKNTDLNIQGSGFFTLQDKSGGMVLSRAGNFILDSNGNLTNPQGLKVLGSSSVASSSASVTPIRVPTSLKIEKVPSAAGDSISTVSNSAGSVLSAGTFTMTVNGTPKTVTIASTDKISDVCNSIQTAIGGTSTVSIDANGAINVVPGTDGAATPTPNTVAFSGATSDTSNFLNLMNLKASGSNFVSDNIVNNQKVTISPGDSSASTYKVVPSISIGKDGSIEATYANGDKLTVSGDPNRTLSYKTSTGVQISSANITVNNNAVTPAELQLQFGDVVNPNGLVAQSGNTFVMGPNSGNASFSVGSSGGIGSIQSGGLEGSNVDLSTEFTQMIVAQRGVEANGRTFDAENNIMRTIVNMAR